jgi:hypothetical protein
MAPGSFGGKTARLSHPAYHSSPSRGSQPHLGWQSRFAIQQIPLFCCMHAQDTSSWHRSRSKNKICTVSAPSLGLFVKSTRLEKHTPCIFPHEECQRAIPSHDE